MSEPTDVTHAASQFDQSIGAQYALVRARIIHEDELINQRLVWMITLNGLLFTAYGFSLSAEGSSLSALAAAASAPKEVAASIKDAYDSLTSTIITIRSAMTWIGISSSLAAFFGVIAANRAIRNDQAYFADYLRGVRGAVDSSVKVPLILGRWSTNLLGMVSAMAVPFLVAGTWMWTIKKFPDWFLISIGLALASGAWLVVWVLKDPVSIIHGNDTRPD